MTILEQELKRLPESEREAAFRRTVVEFRRSIYFDLLRICLRDLEQKALEHIRTRSTEAQSWALATLALVDSIRRTFDCWSQEPADWEDAQESW